MSTINGISGQSQGVSLFPSQTAYISHDSEDIVGQIMDNEADAH